MKKTLKVGIAPREAIARHARDLVAGHRRRTADDPDVWFTSIESFAKVLSKRNQELLALIAERRPDSLEALAAASGRAKSNLSRNLRTMARYGLVRLEMREGRKLKPIVAFQQIKLRLALAASVFGMLDRDMRPHAKRQNAVKILGVCVSARGRFGRG